MSFQTDFKAKYRAALYMSSTIKTTWSIFAQNLFIKIRKKSKVAEQILEHFNDLYDDEKTAMEQFKILFMKMDYSYQRVKNFYEQKRLNSSQLFYYNYQKNNIKRMKQSRKSRSQIHSKVDAVRKHEFSTQLNEGYLIDQNILKDNKLSTIQIGCPNNRLFLDESVYLAKDNLQSIILSTRNKYNGSRFLYSSQAGKAKTEENRETIHNVHLKDLDFLKDSLFSDEQAFPSYSKNQTINHLNDQRRRQATTMNSQINTIHTTQDETVRQTINSKDYISRSTISRSVNKRQITIIPKRIEVFIKGGKRSMSQKT